ncbi:hypothetical protein G3444_02650 [Shewanella baltica]|nr:hypothetical protein [Shewanella baltica]MCS6233510.1 hypothetical protein [Shewanella baltica]
MITLFKSITSKVYNKKASYKNWPFNIKQQSS